MLLKAAGYFCTICRVFFYVEHFLLGAGSVVHVSTRAEAAAPSCLLSFPWVTRGYFNLRQRQHISDLPPPPNSPASCVAALGHSRGPRFPWPHISGWLQGDLGAVLLWPPALPSPPLRWWLLNSCWIPVDGPRCPGRLLVLLCHPMGMLPTLHPERPFHPQGCPQRGLSLPSRSLDATSEGQGRMLAWCWGVRTVRVVLPGARLLPGFI